MLTFSWCPHFLYAEQYQEAEDVPGLADGSRDVCHLPICTHSARYRCFHGGTPWVPYGLSRWFAPAGTPRPVLPLSGGAVPFPRTPIQRTDALAGGGRQRAGDAAARARCA